MGGMHVLILWLDFISPVFRTTNGVLAGYKPVRFGEIQETMANDFVDNKSTPFPFPVCFFARAAIMVARHPLSKASVTYPALGIERKQISSRNRVEST